MAVWYQVTITAEAANDDVTRLDFDNESGASIYISQNAYTDDGYRIVCYDDGGDISVLRSGSKAVLRSYKDGSTSSAEYNTIGEAETARDALAASDGYEVLDLEQPVGSAPTKVIQRRPPMWNEYWADDDSQTAGRLVDSRTNDWAGRSETDRP